VCKAWQQIAAEVTPHQLSFEFDLVEDTSSSTELKTDSKSILQLLLSQPVKLLQLLTGQPRQQQQEQALPDEEDADAAADQLQRQQFLQYLQNAPWERWLHQHGMHLQDFSMSITNLDTSCAAAQCQLKETLLRALSASATAKPALSTSSSFPQSSSSSGPRPSDSGSDGSVSPPVTPLSTSCSEFSEISSSDSSTTNTASTSSSSSNCSTSSLRLQSLHLKVPLFECDVLLLAHGVCAKAPALKALSLVGYSTSGAVKTRTNTSSSSTGRGSRHRLPINPSSNATSTPSSSAAGGAEAGASAPLHGSELIPVGHSSPPGGSSSSPSWTLGPSTGRGGFITGSSLKQLMSSVPQLESLTFACRQLYKLNWLAPATQLTHLSLRDCSLGGDLVKQLAGLNLPKLRAVDLSGSKGLGGADADKHLRQLTRIAGGQLEQIDISGWDLASAGGSSRELPHLPALKTLSVLKMECCGLKGWAVEVGQLPGLTSLSLSGNPLDSQGVAAACSMTQLRELELAHVAPRELALMPQQRPGQGPACWSGMQGMPHLTSLNLSGNFWPDNSLPDRSPVLAYRAFKHNLCSSITAMPKLAKIDLTDVKAPYFRTSQLLAQLPASVTEVVLDGAVEGVRRADLEALQQLARLRVLSACGCNVRDKHVSVLSGLRGLRSLLLRDNALGREGLADLVVGCRQLTLLDVTGNERLSSRADRSSSGSSNVQGTASMCSFSGQNSRLVLLRD